MIIERDGKKIKLTREEIERAHFEFLQLSDRDELEKELLRNPLTKLLPSEHFENLCNTFFHSINNDVERFGCSFATAMRYILIEDEEEVAVEYIRSKLKDTEPFKSMTETGREGEYKLIADLMRDHELFDEGKFEEAFDTAYAWWKSMYDAEREE